MSVNKYLLFAFIVILQACAPSDLKLEEQSTAQEDPWSFDTWGDDCENTVTKRWATVFEIKQPVLGSDRSMISSNPELGWPLTSWPTFYYIDESMTIEHSHSGYSYQVVSQNIETLLGM
jgi:hypothetical protein